MSSLNDVDRSRYCTFYFVRHGETEWNVLHLLQGHADSPLTERGIEQARRTAQELKKIPFDLAFSSDLLRAKRTAEIIAMEHELAVNTTKLLRERSMGKLEGQPSATLREIDRLLETMSHEERMRYKFDEAAESDEEVIFRLIAFIREIAVSCPGKNVLVTTHGGVMRSLLIHLGVGTYDTLAPNAVSNAAYIELLSDGTDFFIGTMNGITRPA